MAVGIGLIGTGYMGKCHALAWNAVASVFGDLERPVLAHLAEVDAALAARRADEFGFARATGDWRALIADPAVDIVSITTPNAFHAEMAIAALEAGKHVWCEKPMAPTIVEAQAMKAAATRSGKLAILGYNYIQNPIIRQIRTLLAENTIGAISHVRIEMDEDFMADPAALFTWKSEQSSGYGALDDFGVHPISLLHFLLGDIARVSAHMSKPFATRPTMSEGPREVETFDIATIMFDLESGASGLLALNRAAWGRKGRIALQIFGSTGAILFDQERMNEFQLYTRDDHLAVQGFRTILCGPVHAPYDRFMPAPGHGLGFNDLKIIECHELLNQLAGHPAHTIDFATGLSIEKAVHAMARSHAEQRWVSVP
ncbi:Gfo/Idh/MocA family oxidoreductase [Devosia algicola]|uniref:Gfo/Idh/MocA family oxidoreductase n=1 Tax=Devosia algicola TaxID=3026418 RepID=A0ABY7YJI5_9HYPH|nr:Gfo/Idh/MocA family oxidoreductase [Devosia algicola]WDR01270.1 Gfo/Idh/MocA family oxidoreductase [Devosia algicola]